jgi:hypothetical protein
MPIAPTATNYTVPTQTATPASTATATSTTGPALPTVTPSDHGPNAKNIGPDNPSSGRSNPKGPNVLMLSLGISTPLLFFGGSLFWLYLRRNQQVLAVFQKVKKPAVISSSAAELTEPLYRPGNLRPMTMSLPIPITNQPMADPKAYLATSNMNPLSLDMFELAHDTPKSTEPEYTADQPVPTTIPENLTPTAKIDLSSMTLIPNALPPTAAETLAAKLPDVASDPMLDNAMHQAQIGLFVIPGHNKKLSNFFTT